MNILERCKSRIDWLEGLLDKARSYIRKLERDRNSLLEELEKSNKEAKYYKQKASLLEKENKDFERENKALKLLLKDLYKELNEPTPIKVIEKETIKEVPVIKEVLKEIPMESNDKKSNNNDLTIKELREALNIVRSKREGFDITA